MKMIDEKGKIFGAINIVDLMVILAIAIIGFVVVTKTGFMQKVNSLENKKPYEMQVISRSVLPHMAEQVVVGDTISEDASNNVIGKVTNVEVKIATNEVPTADGRILLAEIPTRRDVLITIKGEGQIDNVKGLVFGNKDWQAGGSIVVKSNRVKFGGNIYNIKF